MSKTAAPQFSWAFLAPKYWLTWLGISMMLLVSLLPYRILMYLGSKLGQLLLKVGKKRAHVARRNLQLCFPDMPENEREQLLLQNFENTGIAMFESAMAWFWPIWRIKKMTHFEGEEHIQQVLDEGKGVLALAFHFLSLEMSAHTFGLKFPMVGFYRKHNNALMEWMQHRGRIRTNKYLIHKKDVKGLLKALNNGEVCIYLPDQDYGRSRAEFVPFFAVPDAATTTGTLIFANHPNCKVVPIIPYRLPNFAGYTIKALPALEDFPTGDDKQDCARVNKIVEQAVMVAPEQYMWLHKRFKTRPNKEMISYY